MSVPPEALQKLLVEMDNQLNRTKAELNMVTLQLNRADTNLKVIQQTKSKLNTVCKDDEKVWKGIGKAFVQTDVNSYLKTMASDEKEFSDTRSSLEKKKQYLDITLENTVKSMRQIVQGKN